MNYYRNFFYRIYLDGILFHRASNKFCVGSIRRKIQYDLFFRVPLAPREPQAQWETKESRYVH